MSRCVLAATLVALVAGWGCKDKPEPECGNNKTEAEEVCDGTDVNGETCQTMGFLGIAPGGGLGCLPDCSGYNLRNCRGGCGNDLAEGMDEGLPADEACDGSDLRGQNCTVVGFELGTVTCLADCTGFDDSLCRDPVCGDGTVEGSEDCEPDVPITIDCLDLPGNVYDDGELTCAGCRYDTSACITWECGNGIIEGLEDCDGTTFRTDDSCEAYGHDGGTLSCFPPGDPLECDLDESTCVDYECGNDTVEPTEDCEPAVPLTTDCVAEGFLSGTLGCTAAGDPDECLYDFSACVGGCGNDIIEGIADGLTADEACDGTDLAGEDCTTLGHTGGTLACQGDCTAFDETGCVD